MVGGDFVLRPKSAELSWKFYKNENCLPSYGSGLELAGQILDSGGLLVSVSCSS